MRRILAACGMAAILVSAAWLGFGMPLSGGRCGSSFGADNSQGFAEDPTFTDTPTNPTLKDMLAKGLKARLPEEFAFVDRVVKMVDHEAGCQARTWFRARFCGRQEKRASASVFRARITAPGRKKLESNSRRRNAPAPGRIRS